MRSREKLKKLYKASNLLILIEKRLFCQKKEIHIYKNVSEFFFVTNYFCFLKFNNKSRFGSSNLRPSSKLKIEP